MTLDDLRRTLLSYEQRLRQASLDEAAARMERAARFSIGSQTEFIGESLYALDDTLASKDTLDPELRHDMRRVADELEAAMKRSGYSPRHRRRP